MNILYVSVLCSKKKYTQLYGDSKVKPLQQDQKYHGTMAEGLASHDNIKVTAVTSIPITGFFSKPLFHKKEVEFDKDIKFIYLAFLNIPIIRHIFLFIGSFISALLWCLKKGDRDKIVICDILDISIASGAMFAAKLTGNKSIGILTDVPGYLADNSKRKKSKIEKVLSTLIQKINMLILHMFDAYVFLTKHMNPLVNSKKKEYVVIEGQVDIRMEDTPNDLEKKYDKLVCMYAGSLKKIYGIKMLVEAFIKADIKDAELHIYGAGNFEDELSAICRETEKVKYFGTVANDIVVKEQIKATLLINPRPTNEEYTKYSFPSKNMEYMVSGTPMLTTKLPGIPDDYLNYIYIIEDETVDGLAVTLTRILSKPRSELHQMGMAAKRYVLKEKNNVIQSKKIIELAYEITKGTK